MVCWSLFVVLCGCWLGMGQSLGSEGLRESLREEGERSIFVGVRIWLRHNACMGASFAPFPSPVEQKACFSLTHDAFPNLESRLSYLQNPSTNSKSQAGKNLVAEYCRR